MDSDRDEHEIIKRIELNVDALRDQIQQQIIPDYRPLLTRIETVQNDYNTSIQKLEKQIIKLSTTQSTDHLGMALNNLSGEVQVLSRLLRRQESFTRRWISWQALVVVSLATSFLTGTLVFWGLRFFNNDKDQLLDAKLNIIYQRIEDVQKQTSP